MKRLDFTFPVNLWRDEEKISVSAFYSPEKITEDEVLEQVGMHKTSISQNELDFDDRIVILATEEADKLEKMLA